MHASSKAPLQMCDQFGFKHCFNGVGCDLAHGNDVDRLKRQIQKLKSELVKTTASHEEEQENLEKVKPFKSNLSVSLA